MRELCDAVTVQSWSHIFQDSIPIFDESEVRKFYCNAECLENDSIETQVKGVKIKLTEEVLGEILGVPLFGIRSVFGKTC